MKKRIITFSVATVVIILLAMLYYVEPIRHAIAESLAKKDENTKAFIDAFRNWNHRDIIVAIPLVILLSVSTFIFAKFEPVNDKTMSTKDVTQQTTIIKNDNQTNVVIVEEKETK